MTFEPFLVDCVTCSTAIEVTDPSLRGTITTCPHCGSMTQIPTAPTPTKFESTGKTVDSEFAQPPIRRDGMTADSPLALGDRDVDSQAVTRESITPPPVTPGAVEPPAAPGAEAVGPFRASIDDGLPVEPPPVTAPPRFESDAAVRRRQIALIVSLSAGGLVLATVLFVAFVRYWQGNTESSVAQRTTADGKAGPTTAVEPDDASAQPDSGDITNPRDGATNDDAEPDESQSGTEIQSDTAEPSDQSKNDDSRVRSGSTIPPSQEPMTAGDSLDRPTPNDPTPNDPTPSDPTPNDLTRNDPTPNDLTRNDLIPDGLIPNDLIPDGLIDASPLDSGAAASDVAPDRNEELGTLSELPPGLAALTGQLSLSNNPETPQLPGESADVPVQVEAAAEAMVDPLLVVRPPDPVNIEIALRFQNAFNTKGGYEAADFLLLLSSLSAVPIQIDAFAFDLVGVDLRQRCEPIEGLASRGDHLRQIADQIGGRLVQSETEITLVPQADRLDAAFERVTDLQDFGSGRESAAATLQRFLDVAVKAEVAAEAEVAVKTDTTGEAQTPAQTPAEAGVSVDVNFFSPEDLPPRIAEPNVAAEPSVPGQIRVGREAQARLLAMLASEGLRRARGLPGKIPDAPLDRWTAYQTDAAESTVGEDAASSWRRADWPPLNGGRPGPQLDAPISVAQMLLRTARLNAASCLVNWNDGEAAQVAPTQQVLPHAARGAADMMRQSLAPLGLDVRQMDANMWWVGTEARYDRLSVLAWTRPMPPNAQQRFLRRLADAADQTGSVWRAAVDGTADASPGTSGRILLMLPRFLLRQMPEIQATK